MKKNSITCLLGFLLTAAAAVQANAQQPVRHELIRGDMRPGEAAHFYQQADPSLIGKIQPVQLIGPAETTIEIGDAASSFGQAQAKQMTVAMGIGYVYRFKLSNFPQPDAVGKSLYPSIEVIGKLNPPVGLENDFPVQVVVTRDDIDIALAGRMVTRVIYLEDSRGTLPHLHTETEQPSTDVRRGQDPLRTAERLGRPMAILRMGSRVPMEGEVAEWFTFGVAAPQVLPNPRSANVAGLNERELKIVREMEQAEAEAAIEAKIKADQKQAAQVTQAAFDTNETEQLELMQTANEETGEHPTRRIGMIAETSAQPELVLSAPVIATSPTWVRDKANAASQTQTKRSSFKNMIPVRAVPAAGKTSNARPPAPSMSGMYFEPLGSTDTTSP